MDRFLRLLALFLTLPAPSLAQEACLSGLSDVFTLKEYQVTKDTSGWMDGIRLETTLINTGSRGVRMVDGSIVFQDVLGRDILRIAIDPDLKAGAGETSTQKGSYSNTRLLNVAQEDVIVTTCIRGLVYDDGEVFKVSEQ